MKPQSPYHQTLKLTSTNTATPKVMPCFILISNCILNQYVIIGSILWKLIRTNEWLRKVGGQTYINLYTHASKSHLKISSDFWNYFMKTREMAQQVKALLLWRTQMQFLALTLWLTTISNCSSRESNSCFWPLRTPGMYVWPQACMYAKYSYTIIKTFNYFMKYSHEIPD